MLPGRKERPLRAGIHASHFFLMEQPENSCSCQGDSCPGTTDATDTDRKRIFHQGACLGLQYLLRDQAGQ
jgi:hypothetical protein